MTQLLQAVHGVGDEVRDAETGQRGYLLTGRIAYLAPYQQAVSQGNVATQRLRQAASRVPWYLPRVDSLNYFVGLKLAELGETIRLEHDEGISAAQAIVRTDRGQESMNQIRRLLHSLDVDVQGDIGRAQQAAGRERRFVEAAFILVTALAVVLGFIINLLHMRQAREQARTYEELERQSYELQLQASELESANAELELTTREMVEQAAEAEVNEARLAGILGSAIDAIVSFDDEQRVIYWNAAAERLLGLKADQIIGAPVARVIPSRFQDEYETRLDEVRRTARTPAGVANLWELAAARADGSEAPVQVSMSYTRAGKQGLYTMILRDVSQQQQLEEQFRQAQKMEAVGRLAGGIAHDFNNLLTVIGASADFLLLEARSGETQLRQDLLEIRQATDRAAGLTRQLLAFSRRQLVQPQLLDLNSVVGEMETMLRRLIGEDITLQTAYATELGTVRLDRGQVEQIIVNLVVNARDAMENGGVVRIRTENAPDTIQETLAAPVGGALGYVVLSVADTGVGMDEETRTKIFEPFFTTKELGKGTGLGLATVYGIVKQCGGDIVVYSAPGDGTEFRLYFPRTQAEELTAIPVPQTAGALQGSETILVVEDEEPLRRLARRILESRGYAVLDAGNGVEAIDIMARHGNDIDLLLSDIVMPVMGGRELVERLLPLYPSLRILFMSGYTEDTILQHRIAELGITVLEKPFTPDALARLVRQTLDRAAQPRMQEQRA